MNGMKLKYWLIVFLLLPTVANAQRTRMKKKDSNAKGTVFAYWGYNRSAYTKSDIRFVGPNYDFTLAEAIAKDRPEPFSTSAYFNFQNLTVPQFNARIGYYFKEHWALSVGYDHLKYIYDDNNSVYLSGYIGSGVDEVTSWEGTYSGEPVTTQNDYFHYENSDGLNYLRLELTRTDNFIQLGGKDQFVLSSNLGLSAGPILSFNDFNFAGDHDRRTISLSGYGFSANAGLRFEFFRHVFLQTNMAVGFHHQLRVRTRPNDSSSFARHSYGFAEADVALGVLFYIKSKNGCDSCPTW